MLFLTKQVNSSPLRDFTDNYALVKTKQNRHGCNLAKEKENSGFSSDHISIRQNQVILGLTCSSQYVTPHSGH